MSTDEVGKGRGVDVRVLEEYVYSLMPSGEEEPCRNLLAATLSRAIVDFSLNQDEALMQSVGEQFSELRAAARSAKCWLFSKSDEVMSFNWVCLALDLNPTLLITCICEMLRDVDSAPSQWQLLQLGRSRKIKSGI